MLKYKGHSVVAFSDPVLAMRVYSLILKESYIPFLEFSYTKDYNAEGVFSFKDLMNYSPWQYVNIRGNECFVSYRKDMQKKYVRTIGYYLQLILSQHEKSDYRAD